MSKVYSIGLKCKCGEYVTFDIVPKVAADIAEIAPSASANTASLKCLCETCASDECEGMSCSGNHRAKYIVYSCSGFTKPLQA
jgi:hypothetical protein